MSNVFVYGTLLFSEILKALTGKEFKTKEAELKGFQRCKVFDGNKEKPYPGVKKKCNSKVKGKILLNVDDESRKIIDYFEKGDYKPLKVKIVAKGTKYPAIVYERTKNDCNLEIDWDEKEFEKKYLKHYINRKVPNIKKEYEKLKRIK